jgi:hypothetical protein
MVVLLHDGSLCRDPRGNLQPLRAAILPQFGEKWNSAQVYLTKHPFPAGKG